MRTGPIRNFPKTLCIAADGASISSTRVRKGFPRRDMGGTCLNSEHELKRQRSQERKT